MREIGCCQLGVYIPLLEFAGTGRALGQRDNLPIDFHLMKLKTISFSVVVDEPVPLDPPSATTTTTIGKVRTTDTPAITTMAGPKKGKNTKTTCSSIVSNSSSNTGNSNNSSSSSNIVSKASPAMVLDAASKAIASLAVASMVPKEPGTI